MQKRFLTSLILASVFISGCSVRHKTQTTPVHPLVRDLPQTPKQQNGITVIKLEPSSYTAQIEYDPYGKHISQWKNTKTPEIVINGGYFEKDYSPSGFLVVAGKRIEAKLFDQDTTGLLTITAGKVSIRDLRRNSIKQDEQFAFALQSYPFLIKDSQPTLTIDSRKRAQRTAVGVDAEKNVYIITLYSTELSLYEFMKELIATGIPFTDVLNLDGGPSTGIFANWNKNNFLNDSSTKVSSIIRFQKNI